MKVPRYIEFFGASNSFCQSIARGAEDVPDVGAVQSSKKGKCGGPASPAQASYTAVYGMTFVTNESGQTLEGGLDVVLRILTLPRLTVRELALVRTVCRCVDDCCLVERSSVTAHVLGSNFKLNLK